MSIILNNIHATSYKSHVPPEDSPLWGPPTIFHYVDRQLLGHLHPSLVLSWTIPENKKLEEDNSIGSSLNASQRFKLSRESTQWTKQVLYTNASKPIPINRQTLQCIQLLKSPAARYTTIVFKTGFGEFHFSGSLVLLNNPSNSFAFLPSTMEPAADDASPNFTDFTLAEIVDMENLYKELGDQSLHKDFCQTVASSFSFSVNRKGKPSITWEQVQSWFQEKLKQQNQADFKTKPSPPLQIADLSNLSDANSVPKRKGKASDLMDLAFEAKSERDDAWYDVAYFRTYRTLSNGELEARVRFSGFDNQHDEWLNVKRSVRERSIPVEPSECGRVKVGDLLLCFEETEDQALYRDAYVVNIQRGVHDHKRCNCVFLVRFDGDNTEEPLGIDKICRRPDQ
ncbi:unnamed protein product [Microthlaspi erraticum]|uniref:SAWADEE domain-containing protein n=1 Tax=Microthlaspi erraticum TaxID=1685480 RepID=A0A6D2IQ39_9BRAS|nr:unnamed protein product [Microthlaspi erraticum]CAA7049391.1 unnamed protein product [Microthlaspi erraticum]